MAVDLLSGATGASAKIGRYFTVVSMLPSAVLTAYVYLLVKTGAWGGAVDWSAAVSQFHLGDLALLATASFAVALALHPLQFAMIQVLEGYWGTTAPARRFAVLRIMHHRRRSQFLTDRSAYALSELARMPERDRPSHRSASLAAVEAALVNDESRRLQASYPVKKEHILPTRLGNALRRYEMTAGSPYGIDVIPSLPRIAMVSQPAEIDYLQNQRMQMELAVRTAVLAMVAALITVAFMWRHQGWLLVALVPYAAAYASYRGAVTVAHGYGTAMAVLVELNRFDLYERLRLRQPETLEQEKGLNTVLMQALRLQEDVHFDYVSSQPQAPVCPEATVASGVPDAESADDTASGSGSES